MIKGFIILFFFVSITQVSASIKDKIIQNLKTTNNLTFNFEQNVNGETQNGNCAMSFPRKIFCEYNLENNKILVSNGKSIVIKTSSSYYQYPLKRTPLILILDKDFLIKKIRSLNERIIDNKFVNFKFFESDFEINIFFDFDDYNLVGWQTNDIYQNLSITYLSSTKKNQKLRYNLFSLPKQN